MKRILILILALCPLAAFAQNTQKDYLDRYTRQVNRLGIDGIGVSTILDRWEADFPEDPVMMEARFAYFFGKSRTQEVQRMDAAKYLGQKPILSIPDSTGAMVNYFQVSVFDESYFSQAINWIDKAISLYPQDITYRCDKLNALCEYEAGSPDLAVEGLNEMIDKHFADTAYWKSDTVVLCRADFCDLTQEYCFKLYKMGTPGGYEAFKSISEKMNKKYPKDPDFLTNIGSYYLVYAQNLKKAEKYYKKALKIKPDDPTATANMKVIERKKASKK